MSPSQAQPCLESELHTLQQAYADLEKVNDKLQKKHDALIQEVSTLRDLCLQDGLASKEGEDEEAEDKYERFAACHSFPISPETKYAHEEKEEDENDRDPDRNNLTSTVPPTPPNTPTHHHPPQKAIVRNPRLVALNVTLHLTSVGTADAETATTHSCFHLEASGCSSIRQFCHQVTHAHACSHTTCPQENASGPGVAVAVAVEEEEEEEAKSTVSAQIKSAFYPSRSATRFFPDLSRATIKLEEDGHMAEFTMSPTRLDETTPFPDLQYHAWYERNVVRGRGDKVEYVVSVKMTI
ncbi:hypothetical protein RBB50_009544 [Rhinocladiella similis]